MIRLALLSMAVGFSGAVVPGPLFALTLQQSLVVGWTAGFLLAFGHMLAELALVIALRLGLGGVLQRPAVARGIGLIGGGVLLYFAWLMLDLVLHGSLAETGKHATALSAVGLIGQGAALSLFNPYWILWWATAGMALVSSQLINQGRRAWIVFFLGHSLSDYLWFGFVSIIIAIGGHFISPALHRGIIAACAAGVAVLACIFIGKPVVEVVKSSRLKVESLGS